MGYVNGITGIRNHGGLLVQQVCSAASYVIRLRGYNFILAACEKSKQHYLCDRVHIQVLLTCFVYLLAIAAYRVRFFISILHFVHR